MIAIDIMKEKMLVPKLIYNSWKCDNKKRFLNTDSENL